MKVFAAPCNQFLQSLVSFLVLQHAMLAPQPGVMVSAESGVTAAGSRAVCLARFMYKLSVHLYKWSSHYTLKC